MSHELMVISHVLMLISHVLVCLHMLMRFHHKLEWGNHPEIPHDQLISSLMLKTGNMQTYFAFEYIHSPNLISPRFHFHFILRKIGGNFFAECISLMIPCPPLIFLKRILRSGEKLYLGSVYKVLTIVDLPLASNNH